MSVCECLEFRSLPHISTEVYGREQELCLLVIIMEDTFFAIAAVS